MLFGGSIPLQQKRTVYYIYITIYTYIKQIVIYTLKSRKENHWFITLPANFTNIQLYWDLGVDNNDIQLYWGERGKHDVQLYTDLFKKYINFFWCTTEHGHHKVMRKYKKRANKKKSQ